METFTFQITNFPTVDGRTGAERADAPARRRGSVRFRRTIKRVKNRASTEENPSPTLNLQLCANCSAAGAASIVCRASACGSYRPSPGDRPRNSVHNTAVLLFHPSRTALFSYFYLIRAFDYFFHFVHLCRSRVLRVCVRACPCVFVHVHVCYAHHFAGLILRFAVADFPRPIPSIRSGR